MKARSHIKRGVMLSAFLAAALILGSGVASATHSSRMIFVNGVLLNPYQTMEADRSTGFRLPNGAYWYDDRTGLWGVVGGPAVGRVNTGANSRPRRWGGLYPIVIDPSGGCEGGSCVNILD